MKFPRPHHYLSGLAVPLSALKGGTVGSIGEFPDLVPLGQLCQKLGLDGIQLLPINDTGLEPSPYNALSANALHPVYLRIEDLPQSTQVKNELATFHALYDRMPRLAFRQQVQDKLKILRGLYQHQVDRVLEDADLQRFIVDNPWVIPYAVFMDLKLQHGWASWQTWPVHRYPSEGFIEEYWNDPRHHRSVLFFAWLQYHCERQLRQAVQALEEMGVFLKGDIPILINEDSVDAWANPQVFSLELRAGAPPDPGSPDGQNWGFPIYRWEVLERQGYQWWKTRLAQADKFYHAYRIDHVLGFFRIWATPAQNFSANLGYFIPSEFVSQGELNQRGFGAERIRWLSEPHIPGQLLRDQLGLEWLEAVKACLEQIGREDLYCFRPNLGGEKAIQALPLSPHARQVLIGEYRNRALIWVEGKGFTPSMTYYRSRAYQSLSDGEKWTFDSLAQEVWRRSEDLWRQQGEKLMDLMKDTTPMLVCAEDLGAVPQCVPQVLRQKRILGLKIPRWARHWNHPGQPYEPVSEYPLLSVCAPSVHDTSTLRQWWYEEPDHSGFLGAIGINTPVDGDYTPATAREVMRGLMRCGSLLFIPALQDWLGLDEELREADPENERINVPGTVTEKNWSYRIKVPLDELALKDRWVEVVRSLVFERRQRPLPEEIKEVFP